MTPKIDSYLTESDTIVLQNLFKQSPGEDQPINGSKLARDAVDVNGGSESESRGLLKDDESAVELLRSLNDPNSATFQPTVFVTWDAKDIPQWLNDWMVKPYAKVASSIVRHPTDVVFLTHILLYSFVNLPSAVWLYFNFTYLHGIAHAAFSFWCAGSYTLMLHNHIHNNGVLAKEWAWLDFIFPYLTEPLMGHTWDSYYYHHVKHHHVEGNGPEDLSSTLRYQRDDLYHFLHYLGRFMFFIWLDLPLYFIRKNKLNLAARAAASELTSMAFLLYMTCVVNTRASVFVLIVPFVLMRIGLMVGNWGQHALVDEVEPDSDFRSSITLIDVPSNRFCFNDGYHTAHHLNPRRHWREQPVHFLQSKQAYSDGRALVFHNIDYLMMTFKLLQKDYAYLARCLIPIGEQVQMSQQELADMLRKKTRRFTEEDIKAKFKQAAKPAKDQSLTSSTPLRLVAIAAVNVVRTR